MSYCRTGNDSDIYMTGNNDGYYECHGCSLEGNARLPTAAAAVQHLFDHMKAGHKVPQRAIHRLLDEIEEHGVHHTPSACKDGNPAENAVVRRACKHTGDCSCWEPDCVICDCGALRSAMFTHGLTASKPETDDVLFEAWCLHLKAIDRSRVTQGATDENNV